MFHYIHVYFTVHYNIINDNHAQDTQAMDLCHSNVFLLFHVKYGSVFGPLVGEMVCAKSTHF